MLRVMHADDEAAMVALWLRVDDLTSRIDLSKFGMPMEVTLSPCGGPIELRVKLTTKDVDSGRPAVFIFTKWLPVLMEDSDAFIVEMIYDGVLAMVKHEISECFLFDGKRFVNDGIHP